MTLIFASGCTAPKVHADNPVISSSISSIYASDGSLITTVPTDVLRMPIKYSQLGPFLPEAVVAIEDRRYWSRGPIDLRAILRAAVADVSAGAALQGGSTIEEQLVKLELGTPKRTLVEKLHEILLSLGSLSGTTRQQVLAAYLNDVYLGEGTYGVQAASIRYFDRPANELDLFQAATLAGLINAPSAYDPLVHPALAASRRNVVLAAMYSQHEIDLATYQRGIRSGLELDPSVSGLLPSLGYFSQQVISEAETLPALGATPAQRLSRLEHGGLRVVTTEVPTYETAAQAALARAVPRIGQTPTGALASIDPSTGAIQALVGGLGYDSSQPASQFNMATQAERPAGSTFKVIALAEALMQGISPQKIYFAPKVLTVPGAGGAPTWVVHNYEGEPTGNMTLATATILSVNTVYAQLIQEIGPNNVMNLAHAMGIRSKLEPYDSIVLGSEPVTPLDMASVFATIADYGVHNVPYAISAIYDGNGNLIYQHHGYPKRVIPATVAATEIGVLRNVVTEGTGFYAAIGRPVAGKTGTGENWADAWFGGFVPQLATAVWVGYPQGEVPMIPPRTPIYVVGGSWPAMAFSYYNVAALGGTPVQPFRTPASFAKPAPSGGTQVSRSPGLMDVVGMPGVDSQKKLSDAGYLVKIVYAPSGEYPPGYTTAQSPAAGSDVAPGTDVTITVSNGTITFPQLVNVPDLLGKTSEAAATAIGGVGLSGNCQFQTSPPPILAPDTVWEQSPAPGTQVAVGSTISCLAEPAS
ncbi:MAG: transglycosylase domain-containing protein [Nitrospiraceae bacterium]|nr:transglycosylase domain-containing protein [Nitrospiraceae bacterium]